MPSTQPESVYYRWQFCLADAVGAMPRQSALIPNSFIYNQLNIGRHFAVWEQRQLFCEEVRAGFGPLRK